MNNNENRFGQLLGDLGRKLNTDLDPSADGVVTIELDDVLVSLESPDQSVFVYFHAPIRRTNAGQGTDLAEELSRNMFGLPLTGSWIALDRETQELVLCYSAQLASVTEDNLVAMIEAIASAVTELRHDHLSAAVPSPEADFRTLGFILG